MLSNFIMCEKSWEVETGNEANLYSVEYIIIIYMVLSASARVWTAMLRWSRGVVRTYLAIILVEEIPYYSKAIYGYSQEHAQHFPIKYRYTTQPSLPLLSIQALL